MSIATKRGDTGQTGLSGGIRVSKSDLRVETYGTTDELKTWLGLARSLCPNPVIAAQTETIQRTLFRLGSALATPPESAKQPPIISAEDIAHLTSAIAEHTPATSHPGTPTTPSATFNVARTICLRAARNVTRFAATGAIFQPTILQYLHHLAELLAVFSQALTAAPPYPAADRESIYRAIAERRDVRHGFLPTPIAEPVLTRILEAAHQAPSVGFMQPTRFLIIRDPGIRAAVHSAFQQANQEAAATYTGERAGQYKSLKLEGLLEAPQHLCILSDTTSERGHRLGRHTMPETALYSTVCAVQNLWLAARAEGIGVGWVSILDTKGPHPNPPHPSAPHPRRLYLPRPRHRVRRPARPRTLQLGNPPPPIRSHHPQQVRKRPVRKRRVRKRRA